MFARLLSLSAVLVLTRTSAALHAGEGLNPKHEVRAVWVTTAAGLDWPRSSSPEAQRSSLVAIVRDLRERNFNTIFFQVRARGDAYYRSSYEPWAENLTGTLGRDPGWDPLATLLEEAHRLGMEVHAWFNVYKIRGPQQPTRSTPLHPAIAHRGWVTVYENEGWFDPGIPAVRSYLLDVALELVRSYELDGINFDFLRYPGRDFPDAETFQRFGGQLERDEWRRRNITAFVTEFYERAAAIDPLIKVGSSPIGVYNPDPASGASGAFATYFQESREWLRSGTHDYLSPQIYWDIGVSRADPDFAALVEEWVSTANGRHIYAGIAAYKPEVLEELPRQIDVARGAGAQGEVFFRYEHVRDEASAGGRYATLALFPPMRWKDSAAPVAPAAVTVNETRRNVFRLTWTLPDSGPAPARNIVIYRSTHPDIPTEDARTIVALVPASARSFEDSIRIPAGVTYYYGLTALGRAGNESPPSPAVSGVVEELLAIRRKVTEITSVSASLDPESGRPTLIAYRLGHTMIVRLDLLRRMPDGTDRPFATLVDATQEGGTYVVGVQELAFRPGQYLVRLSAGTALLEQPLLIRD